MKREIKDPMEEEQKMNGNEKSIKTEKRDEIWKEGREE